MEKSTKMSDLELLFEEQVRLTEFMSYGFSAQDLMEGKKPVPNEGARFDIRFEGVITGEKIRGKVHGTDFLEVRADGRFILNLQACITTEDGAKIKVVEHGTNDQGALKLFMSFHTNDERYTWLNNTEVLGLGYADLSTGMVHVKGYQL